MCRPRIATNSVQPHRARPNAAARVVVLLALALPPRSLAAQVAGPPASWEAAAGFRIDVAASRFEFPTAIAFVPRPGTSPDAPRYFVAELQGRIKVVTNDGSVHVFADDFTSFRVPSGGPINENENGTAGLCLDGASGHVYVTFVYRDTAQVLRNAMTRFETTPGTFALRPRAQRPMAPEVLEADSSTDSHQIGPCRVIDGSLFVTVGDGHRPERSSDLTSTLGKVLRMTLDGSPAPGNPHAGPGARGAQAYVWAAGIRNVFGFTMVRGRLFGAENGEGIDRIVELVRGRDMGWDGSDWSLGMNATMVFAPAVSPVNMEYVPSTATFFPPSARDRFYVALSGAAGGSGPGLSGERSIVALDIDVASGKLRRKPAPLVRYAGEGLDGAIVALAIGPDGLYFAPLFPDSSGHSSVMRLYWSPDTPHPYVIGRGRDARSLIANTGCLGCHRLEGRGGTAGPSLNPRAMIARLLERLDQPAYREQLRALDTLRAEPFARFRDARHAVADASGLDRVRLWLQYRLMEPRFDSPAAQMPPPGLSETEARIIADYFVSAGAPVRGWQAFKDRVPAPRYWHIVAAAAAGLAGGYVVATWRRRVRPPRAPGAT